MKEKLNEFLKRYKEGRMIVLDFGTLGLMEQEPIIVEVAAVELGAKYLEGATCQTIVKYEAKDWSKYSRALYINKLTPEVIKEGQDLGETIKELWGFIGDSPIISHTDFEKRVLGWNIAQFKLGDIPQFPLPTILSNLTTWMDSKLIIQEAYPDLYSYRLGDIARDRKFEPITGSKSMDDVTTIKVVLDEIAACPALA